MTVQSSTGESVETIRHITRRIQEIDQFTSAVAASVGQQGHATSEISRTVVNAAQRTRVVSSILEDVAGSIAKTKSSADMVLTASQTVEAAATNLQEKVEGFLRKVAI